ncbi:MAG: D-alanine--D-alanine ligase [Spirochaetaceae bacterium]|nr:D-alanine--D-alanine ligase [Spirochaetaceae bacterium]
MNITIFYGGKSGEHEVSLVSASSIVRNIDISKHKINLVGIAKDGKWYLQPEQEFQRVKQNEQAVLSITEDSNMAVAVIPGGDSNHALKAPSGTIPTDVAFLVLHGTYGEDGTIQGLFDMCDIPYTGCGTASSALAMDKEKTKMIWRQSNLPVLPHVCLKKSDMEHQEKVEKLLVQAEKEFGLPLFVKPCGTGSSVGANKANTSEELKKYVEEAFKWDEKILIEPLINAREIECSVTGNSVVGGPVTSYTPGEIIPTHEFYDYDAKYNDPEGAKLAIPAELSPERIAFIQKAAVLAYKALDCSGLSRVDFFIDKDNDSLYLNEINTMPGFTSISMFPKMCQASGLAYDQLLDLLIQEAVDKFNSKKSIQTNKG